MVTFVLFVFWLMVFTVLPRIAHISRGTYKEPAQLFPYLLDTAMYIILAVWAATLIWEQIKPL